MIRKFPNVSRKQFCERWTSECETLFLLLKDLLISAPILGYADYTKPFVLEVDASLKGLGAAVLSQYQRAGHFDQTSETFRTTVPVV